jgi:hypothetical protein
MARSLSITRLYAEAARISVRDGGAGTRGVCVLGVGCVLIFGDDWPSKSACSWHQIEMLRRRLTEREAVCEHEFAVSTDGMSWALLVASGERKVPTKRFALKNEENAVECVA